MSVLKWADHELVVAAAIIKVDSNLSTCPKTQPHGQVDKSYRPLNIQTLSNPLHFDSDTFQERTAIIQANGLPREWAEGFALLCTMPRPSLYTAEAWQSIVDDAGVFLDRWGRQAACLGWQAHEVFGVHSKAPNHRYDAMGLIVLLQGRPVTAITAETARVDCGAGVFTTFYRGKVATDSVALWHLK